MTMKKIVTTGVMAGAVAMAIAGMSNEANAGPGEGKEKCYGVVKAGHNDCGNASGTHSCMGHAEVDGDAGEWLALPKGICERLVGGSLEAMADEESHDEHEG